MECDHLEERNSKFHNGMLVMDKLTICVECKKTSLLMWLVMYVLSLQRIDHNLQGILLLWWILYTIPFIATLGSILDSQLS